MAKITLEIEDKNLDTVLTILQSIKSELITTINVNENKLSKKPFKYVPKHPIKRKIISSDVPINSTISLKDDYKKNLQNKIK
ncbi:hypothetical protein [Arcobacter sp.]|uniref:hypothetical protein n=1 Tax=unclassified Arcobacter TaxID=2593671 RepID=UPI003B0047BA